MREKLTNYIRAGYRSCWKELTRSYPKLGTSGMLRPACSAASNRTNPTYCFSCCSLQMEQTILFHLFCQGYISRVCSEGLRGKDLIRGALADR